MPHMGRCRRCPDRRDRHRGGNVSGRLEHGGAAERVTHQNGRRSMLLLQESGRRKQVRDVGGEVAVRKIALTLAKTGKIETQHRDTRISQRTADIGGGLQILGTGKTMCEQSIGACWPGRKIEEPRQRMAVVVDEGNPGCLHGLAAPLNGDQIPR